MNYSSFKVQQREFHTIGGIKYSAASHKNCLALSENVNKDNKQSLYHTE